ncbi:hypothetical protein CBR_g16848 [Chara braunii]|uniref:Uncharacterized protein n=1 Tax=Chara braunii TaxID=69332 RepID=A0A388KTW6_CHABU|nr:hypothetical protein CBR_g16848 [Chara braunii]|eukprot:GBG73505.1 hypothetical protein CBR_g16848 [Chara braunii]
MEVAKNVAVEDVCNGGGNSSHSWPSQCQNMFGNLLIAQWEKCGEKGLYRYDITQCQTKVSLLIPGDYGFV